MAKGPIRLRGAYIIFRSENNSHSNGVCLCFTKQSYKASFRASLCPRGVHLQNHISARSANRIWWICIIGLPYQLLNNNLIIMLAIEKSQRVGKMNASVNFGEPDAEAFPNSRISYTELLLYLPSNHKFSTQLISRLSLRNSSISSKRKKFCLDANPRL